MPDTVRLFVAVELPEAARQHIAHLLDTLRARSTHGLRWVKPEGVHLTLKFLGNVLEERLDSIVTAMERATENVAYFSLRIQDVGAFLGAFPNMGSPRVVWAGVQGEVEPLLQLQARLEETLADQGFLPETRPFSPHLTLARVRGRLSSWERQHLTEAMESARGITGVDMPVNRLSLMESTLTPEGAVYTRRGQISLRFTLAS